MLKILHISTHKIGGAGNAAYRLHLALNEANVVNSKFLYRSQDSSNIPKENSISQGKHLIHHRIANQLGFPILAWHKNRKIINSLQGKFEKISFPENDFEVEKHPWVKEADIIHLHLFEAIMVLSKVKYTKASFFIHFHDNIKQFKNFYFNKLSKELFTNWIEKKSITKNKKGKGLIFIKRNTICAMQTHIPSTLKF